jgi:hypothetical protein
MVRLLMLRVVRDWLLRTNLANSAYSACSDHRRFRPPDPEDVRVWPNLADLARGVPHRRRQSLPLVDVSLHPAFLASAEDWPSCCAGSKPRTRQLAYFEYAADELPIDAATLTANVNRRDIVLRSRDRNRTAP